MSSVGYLLEGSQPRNYFNFCMIRILIDTCFACHRYEKLEDIRLWAILLSHRN